MNGWLIYDAEGCKRNGWFIDRLIDSGKKLGLHLTLVLAEDLLFGVKDHKRFVARKNSSELLPDFAVCRTIYPLLSRTLEALGVPTFNSADVSTICNDKRLTHAFFADKGIAMADTFFLSKSSFAPRNYCYPSVIKSPAGHGGREVYLASCQKEAEEIVAGAPGEYMLLQPLVKPGVDVRVYLLGGKILASVKRTSATDFRSNFSLGGNVELYSANEEIKKVTDLVFEKLKPTFVGVDFTFDENGKPLLNEIEDVVGTRMLYKLTDLEVSELLMDEIRRSLMTQI